MTTKQTPCSESTLTKRYQTTIPESIRKVLGLKKHDKICYTILEDGQVTISRAAQTENDPILENFLVFLAQELKKNPQHLQGISANLVSHLKSLVADVDLDLDAPLSDEDE
ncbi:HtaR suppressor protein (plasmid) [Gloeothece citriformis PCC 7424]|uniref:HtaR suppressor protein n=1 Tax=Gloeothece citriformis (strain PCC 7424) TaxID=65393 RepID=B7KM74_GLOC7|nr:type II toxin-antitoxin system PrlF family antitoxin [Gloeothece citriformis]ACK73896.1 HtaR suppressor protein [Gloeothece citriformis PCC 7424]